MGRASTQGTDVESKGENLTGEAMRTDKLGGGGRWRAGNQKEWNLE